MDFETLLLIIIIVYILHRMGLIKIHWSYRWSLSDEDKPDSDKFNTGIEKAKQKKIKLKEQVNSDK